MRQVVAQYEKQCAGRAEAAIRSENSRQEAEHMRLDKALQKEDVCSEKRHQLDPGRVKFDTLNAQDKLSWARLLEEVGRECK